MDRKTRFVRGVIRLGILLDGLSVLPYVVPRVMLAPLGVSEAMLTPVAAYLLFHAGTFMLAWTILLAWALQAPAARRFVLLLTVLGQLMLRQAYHRVGVGEIGHRIETADGKAGIAVGDDALVCPGNSLRRQIRQENGHDKDQGNSAADAAPIPPLCRHSSYRYYGDSGTMSAD